MYILRYLRQLAFRGTTFQKCDLTRRTKKKKDGETPTSTKTSTRKENIYPSRASFREEAATPTLTKTAAESFFFHSDSNQKAPEDVAD